MLRYSILGFLLILFTSLSAQEGNPAHPVFVCAVPDIEKAKLEDTRSGLVPRFALPVNQTIHSQEEGIWIALPGGRYKWVLTIEAPGATSLILISSHIPLPPGSHLLVRDASGKQVESYFPHPRKQQGAMTIGPIAGSRLTLEYVHPQEPIAFQFDDIYYGFTQDYHPLVGSTPGEEVPEVEASSSMCLGFGCSLPCQVNAQCLQQPYIQRSSQSVVQILMVFTIGAAWCTGALINNQRQDGTPYILSAFHCQYGYTPVFQNWAFFFQYESPDCQNPFQEPIPHKVTGSQFRSKWADSDFLLLEITNPLPSVPDITFAGWNRSDNYKPFPTYFLHHPSADIKKISVDSQAATIWLTPVSWGNGIFTPGNHHYRMYFDLGSSEPGSSGGPLFDINGHIIGQLNGGSATCQANALWFGRIQRSWTGGGSPDTRLRDWLDPDQTGIMTLNEKLVEGIADFRLTGKIVTPVGYPIANAQVSLSGQVVQTAATDQNGEFYFDQVDAGKSYIMTVYRDSPHAQGLSVSDLVLFNKYLVGSIGLPTLYAGIAADVNGSNTLSISDLILMRRMLVGVIQEYPGVPSWKFVRSGSLQGSWEINNLSQDVNNLDFIGIKMGDVNHSFQP